MESYNTWIGNRQGLLWVKGKPGAGKSTLMAFLYDKLDQIEGIQLNFFFTARGSELQRTSLGMFRSLLNQIFVLDDIVRGAVRETYEKRCQLFGHYDEHKWPQTMLEELLTGAILTSANQKQVRVFVDALDETGAESAQKLASYFHRLSTLAGKEKLPLQICISCRHYPIISSPQAVEVCVEDHNQGDIATYIDDVLAEMEDDEGITRDMKEELMMQLNERAKGVFQWVHIMVPLLQQRVLGGDSLDDVRCWLDEVPADLEDVYSYILNDVIDQRNRGQSFLLFQWLCFAERALTLTEIRYALVAKDAKTSPLAKKWEKIEGFIDTDNRMKRKLKALSGGLVEVVSGEMDDENSQWGFSGPCQLVQVVHQSVNDFLSNRGLELLRLPAGKNPSLQCGTALFFQSHAALYRSSLIYLTTVKLPQKLTTKDLGRNYPFLAYATKNLFIHAEKSAEYRTQVLHNEIDTLQELFHRWFKIQQCFLSNSIYDVFPIETKIIHVTAFYNLTDALGCLALKGEPLGDEDFNGNTAFHLAARRGHIAVAEILRRNGADCGAVNTKSGKSAMIEAAENGKLEFVEWLLDGGSNVNKAARDGESALQAASERGHHAVVAILIEAGADVNAQGGGFFGHALKAAAKNGYVEVCQLLLDAHADVNAQGGLYGNALQAAAKNGYVEVCQLLLDAHADVNAQGGLYGNALQAAAENGYVEVCQLLLDAHADVNAQGGKYGNALRAAARSRHVEVCQLLLDAHADVNAQGGEYGNALQAAAQGGYIEICQLLLDAHADVNAQGGLYGNALQAAAYFGYIEVCQLLLDAHADVNAQGGKYGNALQAAALSRDIEICQLLLDAHADVNAQGGKHGNALQAARRKGRTDIVKLLLYTGAY
jgi:ankyrin repeat protein